MWWRSTRATYHAGADNLNALRQLVDAGAPVGLLAFDSDGHAIGWCAVAPRSAYPRLATSPMGRGSTADDRCWSVPCFFVGVKHRRQGLTDDLLAAACEHARHHDAEVIEGYPTYSPKAGSYDLFVGSGRLFERHGFIEIRRPTAHRSVMRRRMA